MRSSQRQLKGAETTGRREQHRFLQIAVGCKRRLAFNVYISIVSQLMQGVKRDFCCLVRDNEGAALGTPLVRSSLPPLLGKGQRSLRARDHFGADSESLRPWFSNLYCSSLAGEGGRNEREGFLMPLDIRADFCYNKHNLWLTPIKREFLATPQPRTQTKPG